MDNESKEINQKGTEYQEKILNRLDALLEGVESIKNLMRFYQLNGTKPEGKES